MPMGFPGDSDPRDEEPIYECPECSDLLMQDMFREWFCPTCVREEADTELNTELNTKNTDNQ
jgi:Zn finger protein HypA/HybF involved in hydrogenase expression